MQNIKLDVLVKRKDGQVFAIEQNGPEEYQAVYPEDMADLSHTYPTYADAAHAIGHDIAYYGIGPHSTQIES